MRRLSITALLLTATSLSFASGGFISPAQTARINAHDKLATQKMIQHEARENTYYIGVNGGYNFARIVGPNGNVDANHKGKAYVLGAVAGLQMNPNLSMEAGATQFEKTTDSSLKGYELQHWMMYAAFKARSNAWHRFRAFAKGGLAYEEVQVKSPAVGSTAAVDKKHFVTNFIAGAGLDYQLATQIGLEAQFLYLPGYSFVSTSTKSQQLATIGINIAF